MAFVSTIPQRYEVLALFQSFCTVFLSHIAVINRQIRKQVARAKERELREEVKKLIMSETPSRNLSAEAAAAYETLHSLDKEKRAAKEKAEVSPSL